MRVLVVGTHPDDETLGCGGTLLKLAASGAELHWVLATAAHKPEYSAKEIARQAEQIEAVRAAYGFVSLRWLRFPTTRLDTLPLNEVIGALRDGVLAIRPEIVFVPHPGDVHSDHRIISNACTAVLKSFHQQSLGVRRILACEVLSETESGTTVSDLPFAPNVFVDITETIEQKLGIVRLYRTEIQDDPLPRTPSTVTALARVRGAAIGVEYAEAFTLLRETW
jgi:LmbE family N-acetylglucosaminyl deacetylase